MRILLLLTTLLVSQVTPPRASGAIEGSVVDSITMLPIANAPITLSTGTSQIDAITDQSGRFLIPSLPSGAYVVASTVDDYFGPEITTYVYVTESQTSHTTLWMVPAASISGNVVDDTGAPGVNAAVQVMRVTYRNGIPSTESAGGVSSDENGRYRVIRLRPGEYYVAVLPKAGDPLIRTFSPTALDLSQATMIRLHAGEEVGGINIALRKGELFRVSGQVISAIPDFDATRSAMATVTLLSHASGMQDSSFSSSVTVSMLGEANGRFELANIFPGIYDVFASLSDGRGSGVAYGKTTMNVNGADVENVRVTVHRGVDIQGKVTVDGGASPSFNSVRISLQAEGNAARLAGYQQLLRFQPTVGSNGSFTIPSVPEGQYRIQVAFAPPAPPPTRPVANRSVDPFAPDPTPPPSLVSVPLAGAPLGPNAYVADILQSGMTVYNTGISVGTQAFDPLDVRVRTDGGSVEGIVLDGKLVPFAGATVVLAPMVQHRQNPALYRVAISDEAGRFVMSAIRPGDYKLLAWDSITPGAYMNAEILSNYVEKEYPVTVAANIRVQTRVTVISTTK
jgi:Carboxypeptidase regulatory-like domain